MSGVLAERSTLMKDRKALQAEIAQLHAGNLVAQLDAQGELRSLTRKLRERPRSRSAVPPALATFVAQGRCLVQHDLLSIRAHTVAQH